MYTTDTVAKKTKSKNAEVRYFARKHNVPKIFIKNKEVFIFDKTDYKLFLIYKGKIKLKKENPAQQAFPFYKTQIKKKKQQRVDYDFKFKQMIKILKKIGCVGIGKEELRKQLKVGKYAFEKLLARTAAYPIGEDARIDNKIYWVGK